MTSGDCYPPIVILVPGDVVRMRVGDLVPADLKLSDGHLAVDQSTLTGETLPAELRAAALLRGQCGAARRSHRRSDRDRLAHTVRPDRRTGTHREDR
ncbi:MAG: hypothetical protein U0559_10960 [Anaerolineae bacterium]